MSTCATCAQGVGKLPCMQFLKRKHVKLHALLTHDYGLSNVLALKKSTAPMYVLNYIKQTFLFYYIYFYVKEANYVPKRFTY